MIKIILPKKLKEFNNQCYKIECQIANIMRLTEYERVKLMQTWEPKIGQRIVHIDQKSKEAMAQEKNVFDAKGRFIWLNQNKHFSSYFFNHTVPISRIDGNILECDWGHEIIYRHPKNECFPVLNKWQLFWMKRKIRRSINEY